MDFTPLTDYIERVLRSEKGVPGCDLKIMKEHKTLLRYQSGVSDYEGKKAINENNIYGVYSCTKVITCTAVLMLMEKGILKLDDHISKFLPSFEKVFLIKNGEKVAPKNHITVRHLLTMSAGFDYDFWKEPVKKLYAENPQADTVEIISALSEAPLNYEPGEKFQYSLCHDVLGAVIEAASGMKFSSFLKENIFFPLGIKNIGFAPANNDDLVAEYICNVPGEITPYADVKRFEKFNNYESGGGGLFATVDDYGKFADMLANGGVGINGSRILKAETIDLMRTEQLKKYTMNPQFGCAAGAGYGYGLGVRTLIDKSGGQRSNIGEFGWDGAAGSYVLIDPKEKLSIFFAMQVKSWPRLIGCGHALIRDLTYEILGL